MLSGGDDVVVVPCSTTGSIAPDFSTRLAAYDLARCPERLNDIDSADPERASRPTSCHCSPTPDVVEVVRGEADNVHAERTVDTVRHACLR